MNTRLSRTLVLSGALLTLAIPNCAPQDSGSGSLQILVTDKPFPVEYIESAVVTVTRVEVRRAEAEDGANDNGDDMSNDNSAEGGMPDNSAAVEQTEPDDGDGLIDDSGEDVDPDGEGEDTDDDDDDDDDGAFVVISSETREFDLLDLQNGRTDLLANAVIDAGTYTQMRIFTPGGTVVLTDGRQFDLSAPSGAQSGIKLNLTFEVADGGNTTLLLDVDLSRAFNAIPGGKIADPSTIRNFQFRPSLAMKLINILDAGSISGTVTDADGNPLPEVWVTAMQGGEEAGGTSSDDAGFYRIIGLASGSYALDFSKTGFLDHTASDIAVQAGQETAGVDVQMLPEAVSE